MPFSTSGRTTRRQFFTRSAAATLVMGGLVGCARGVPTAPPTSNVPPTTVSPAEATPPVPTTTPVPVATATAAPTAAATTISAAPVAASTATDQLRAYWVDAFNPGFKSPEEVDRLIADVRRSNANAIIVEIRRRGDAYFNRRIEPRTEDPKMTPNFDALADLLTKARTGGRRLQVHAWVMAFPIARKGMLPRDPAHVFHLHGPSTTGRDNWLVWNNKGQQSDSQNYTLDPGHPDAADYTVRVITDIARQYDVDGVHLDFIRYAQKEYGYNPVSVERFNKALGRTGQPATDDPKWADWRRNQVSAVVRRIYLEIQRIRPSVQLSAALIAWGRGPGAIGGYEVSPPFAWTFQDWHSWLAEGIIDLGIPMVYFNQSDPRYPGAFDEWTKDALGHQGRRRVAIGTGLYLNPPADSAGQIQRAVAAGATGISLYSYATYARQSTVPRSSIAEVLVDASSAPFAAPAEPPTFPWKTASPEAHLFGQALDANGRPLDGAQVTLSGPDSRVVTADGSGYFGAIALTPGSYSVKLTSGGKNVAESTATVSAGTVTRAELRTS